jgi:LuxR family maltose regulon positive regulatory protein
MSPPETDTTNFALLRTKLHQPRIRDDLVPRPRLVGRLNRGLDRRMTLVCAPAGFGKTTLLAQWLADADSPRSVAWLSLDENDNDLVLFLNYIIAAIQTVFPDACPETSSLLKAPQLPPQDTIATILINEISDLQPGPESGEGPGLTLVLDDYHKIEDKTVHQLVAALVGSRLQQMHLVLASRAEPALPLAWLRVGREMTEIRMEDLRFTHGEAQAFLSAAVGESLPDETIAILEERTEGWIAALRLAAISMRSTPLMRGEADREAFVQSFRGTHRALMDYLMAEVLSHQSPAQKEFLLRTSILDRFCAPLCQAVTGESLGESERILAELDRVGMFLVPLDYEHNWYRYHHLFRELLRYRLQAEVGAREIDALHRRAGTWLAGQSLIEESLRYSLTAGDAEGAARLVEKHRHDALNREDCALLERWLDMLPEETVQRRPALLLARAWVLDYRYQIAAIPPLLQAAEACLSADADVWAESALGLEGEIDALWSVVLAWGGHGKQALERALRALERIPPAYAFARSFAMLILALAYQMTGQTETALRALSNYLGEAGTLPDTVITRLLIGQAYLQIRAGNLHQAAQVLHRLQLVADKARLTISVVIANWLLGRISYEWNHLGTASQYLATVFELRYGGHYGMVYDSMVSLALTYQVQGKPDRADETLVAMRNFTLDIGLVERLYEFDAFKALLDIFQGQLQPAIRWAEATPLDMPSAYTFVWVELPITTKARVLIAQGTEASLREAVRLLQGLLTFAGSLHNTYRQIKFLALLALAYQAQGQADDALQALERSVKLAQPGGIVRTFVDLGPGMARLLYQMVERGVEPEYVGQVLAAFDEQTIDDTDSSFAVRPSPIVEPPTRRELEVLKLLSQDLSNKEIAKTLVISPLTVKVHASNIYAKLGVSGRVKAVAQAKALGILPPD